MAPLVAPEMAPVGIALIGSGNNHTLCQVVEVMLNKLQGNFIRDQHLVGDCPRPGLIAVISLAK